MTALEIDVQSRVHNITPLQFPTKLRFKDVSLNRSNLENSDTIHTESPECIIWVYFMPCKQCFKGCKFVPTFEVEKIEIAHGCILCI